MTQITQRQLDAILRSDFLSFLLKFFALLNPDTSFQNNWHVEAIAYQLERVLKGATKRLIINAPPRSLKSYIVSVAFPAFVLGTTPHKRIIGASYSEALSVKLGSDFRRIVESDSYRRIFKPRPPAKSTESEYQTSEGGFRFATSVGGTLTGRGGDLLIVDDPLNAADALSKPSRDRANSWCTGSLISRLDNKLTGAIIAVMQRLHQDDLTGHLMEQGGWEVFQLPAIAQNDREILLSDTRKHQWRVGDPLQAVREPQKVLEELKQQMGTDIFNAQFLQAPVPETGNMLKREWLGTYDLTPIKQEGDQIVQSWDTAMKATETSNYSVCLTFLVRNRNEYYLLDAYRKRPEFPELAKFVLAHATEWRADAILIEDKASGTSLIQTVQRNGLQGVIPIKPSMDKASRMYGQTPKLAAGSLFLPKSAPWLGDFLAECLAFPKGRYDDQVDALSQFLEWRGNRENDIFEFDFGHDSTSLPSVESILASLGR
jgi:predicted phage terminase large subunit-like protein